MMKKEIERLESQGISSELQRLCLFHIKSIEHAVSSLAQSTSAQELVAISESCDKLSEFLGAPIDGRRISFQVPEQVQETP